MSLNQNASQPPSDEEPHEDSVDKMTCSTFAEHKEQTAKDIESVVEILTKIAAEVREGNMLKWEEFWYEGGTEEGDAKIFAIREMLILRYAYRQESIS